MLLCERSKEIFEKLEPELMIIARKYQITDPAGEARSWYMKFMEILKKFDNGQLVKYYQDTTGKQQALPIEPNAKEQKAFERSLSAYLKTSFRHDIFESYRRDVKQKKCQVEMANILSSPTASASFVCDEIITLDDIIDIIAFDLKRATSTASVARDDVNRIFLQSTLNYHLELKSKYGNFPIVRDISAINPGEFFVYDLREGRTEGIRIAIAELLKTEKNRMVILTYTKIAEGKGYHALNRKISRYFNDHLKGMPERLRDMKNKKRLSL